jgi:hypothetical protein
VPATIDEEKHSDVSEAPPPPVDEPARPKKDKRRAYSIDDLPAHLVEAILGKGAGRA